MNPVVAAAESAILAIGAGVCWVLAQGMPSEPFEWTNLSASVMLGGLCVYLVIRIIPSMHDKFNDRLEKRDAQFSETVDKIHANCQQVTDRIISKLDDMDKR